MGRFETTVDYYRYREPYPPEFFARVAQFADLSRETRLLDVGCGPGILAIGFAPYVGSCTAIDREPEMLRAARDAAAAAHVDIRFVETTIEELHTPDDSFDFVCVGRALHWLNNEKALAVFEKIISPGGRIAICGSTASAADVNAWDKPYKQLRRSWSDDPHETRYRVDLDKWFAPSRFRKLGAIFVAHRHRVTVDDLVKRMFSFSTTSPAILGEKQPQVEAEIRALLEPFAKDGSMEEELDVKAAVFG